MKPHCKPVATVLAALLAAPLLAAPRPLVWRADFPSAKVENFPVRHGTDVEFRPSWHVNGVPANTNGEWTLSLSVQTNGAPAGEWSVIPGTVFSHTNDCGADAYNVLVRAVDADGTVDYSAAARLRMLPSPGFEPGALPPAATFQESDPVFSAWLSTFEIPETSLEPSTNYTDRALSSFAATGTVARASSYGTPTRWTDATGCVWEAGEKYPSSITLAGVGEYQYIGSAGGVHQWGPDSVHNYISFEDDGDRWTYYNDQSGVWIASHAIVGGEQTVTLQSAFSGSEMQISYVSHVGETNLVGRVALTNDLMTAETDPTVPDWAKEPSPPSYSAADVGAAPASLVQAVTNLQVESALVYRLYSGSNVVAEVTNYNSQVHAPELRLMQLNESNEYITVWTETNGLSRTLRAATNYADRAIADHAAPRAWSKVTAGMGVEAPSNTTWLSTGRTVIAGGLEWEKHVTSGGAIWLLESNGMTADFNPQTNNVAFLDLSNADGTPIFRVEKTDSFLVGVHIENVTVDGDALVCHVPVVASEHPFVRVSTSLAEGSWHKEEDGIPSSLATVTWTGSVGDWTCRIENNTGGTPFFAQMEYLQEGGTKIVNSAPLDVSNGILCTDGIHKARPVYNNGTIIWEPVP